MSRLDEIEENNNDRHYTDNPNSDVFEAIEYLIKRIRTLEEAVRIMPTLSYSQIRSLVIETMESGDE